MDNQFTLTGKSILVTGASSGLGKSIAIECSKWGASVIITGRNKERLNNTNELLEGNHNKQLVCDLSDKSSFNNMCDSLPKLDGVVMNAGIPCSTPIKHNSNKYMRELFEVNTFSNFNLSKFLIRRHIINNKGSIVFISSVASSIPYMGNSIYSASKAAMNSFARVMALEVGFKNGIRVNTLSPGIVPTKPNDSAFSDKDLKKESGSIPLGFGSPLDIANSCIFLLSDASRWITGTNLVVDGGQSL